MFSWWNYETIATWKELDAPKTCWIRPQLIEMEDSIWWSTDHDQGEMGMVQYDTKLDKIVSVVQYPDHIRPLNHSCCQYQNQIYIVDGKNGQIIAFHPQTKQFEIKVKIPNIGEGATCIAMYDDVHIFGGEYNSKHLVYATKANKLKILIDQTTTSNIMDISVVKYKDKIIRFGGYLWNRNKYVDALFISSRVKRNEVDDIQWSAMPAHKCSKGVGVCGYIRYKQYIIMFGGATSGRKYVDTIYVLNLESGSGWIELQHVKCPVPSAYVAALDANDNIHLLSTLIGCEHYAIPLSTVLKDMVDNDDEDEKDLIESDGVKKLKEIDKNALQGIDELREENVILQSLVEDLVNNQNTDSETVKKKDTEAMQTIQRLKSALNSLRNENQTVKEHHKKAMETIKNLTRENNDLNEECKQAKLELQRVKQELRKQTLDPQNYLQWSPSEVVDWIVSIEDGKYAVYEECLRLVFTTESVNGLALSEISKTDLKEWGIKHFLDRGNLYKTIQELVSETGKIDLNANGFQEGLSSTAYIG